MTNFPSSAPSSSSSDPPTNSVTLVRSSFEPAARVSMLTFLSLAATLVTVVALYKSALGHFFYFDDFHFLSVPLPESLGEWIAPLNPLQSNVVGWYRPITSFYYFAVCRLLFGLNPFPYMLVILLTLLANVVLAFALIWRVTAQPLVALAGSYLYGVNFLHFETLSWASGFQEQGFTLFSLIAVIAYVVSAEEEAITGKRAWLAIVSFSAFILALLSKETAVVVPAWLTLFVLATQGSRVPGRTIIKRLVKTQWPYYTLLLMYLVVRQSALVSHAAGSDPYAVRGIGVTLLHYEWFARWILDEYLYPLQLAKEVIVPGAHLGAVAWIGVGMALFLTSALIVASLLSIRFKHPIGLPRHTSLRAASLGIAWFVIGLLPVSLSSNQAAYYLVLPAVGAYLALACVIRDTLGSITRFSPVVGAAMGLLIFLAPTWGTFQRVATLEEIGAPAFSRVAHEAILALAMTKSRPCTVAEVYLIDFPPQVWPNRSGVDAIRLYCNVAAVRVVGANDARPAGDNRSAVLLQYERGRVIPRGEP